MSKIWTKQDDDRWEGFACACNEDGQRDIAEMRAEVAKFLNSPLDKDFLSAAVYNLEHQFNGASITGMYCDLWAVVNAEKQDWLSQEDPKSAIFTVRAQCDRLEDGVAMVVQAFMKRFPPEGSDGLTDKERQEMADRYAETTGAPLSPEDIERLKKAEAEGKIPRREL